MSNNVLFAKSMDCAGAVVANSIVKMGVADYAILQAAGSAVTEKIIGISTEIPSVSGERIDVVLEGVADLKLGGTVARGDFVTSDVNGLGVTAAPAASVNARIVGVAMISGVAGDIIPCFISLSTMQG